MRFKDLIPNIAVLFSLLFIYIFTTDEIIVSFWLLFVLVAGFLVRYDKGEWKLLLLGIVLGTILELGGDVFNKVQYWEQGNFFGIPLWLPLMWGIGFIYIRRIGNIIIIKKKKS